MAIDRLTMETRGPIVTASDVDAFERRFGHPLPDDYRRST
jgi:hypothetical protein